MRAAPLAPQLEAACPDLQLVAAGDADIDPDAFEREELAKLGPMSTDEKLTAAFGMPLHITKIDGRWTARAA